MTNRPGRTRKKISGVSGQLLGGIDEVFHPTKYEVQLERDRQTIVPAPAPLAGDGDKGIYRGVVKIDLGELGQNEDMQGASTETKRSRE